MMNLISLVSKMECYKLGCEHKSFVILNHDQFLIKINATPFEIDHEIISNKRIGMGHLSHSN